VQPEALLLLTVTNKLLLLTVTNKLLLLTVTNKLLLLTVTNKLSFVSQRVLSVSLVKAALKIKQTNKCRIQ